MYIALRVDASTRMGLGHLARCQTLAAALSDQGEAVRFVCRAHPGNQMSALIAAGYPVTALPAPHAWEAGAADGDYAAWLGVTQAQDAAGISAALADSRPDWLIVDHYALDATWGRTLRPHFGRLLAIDDLANRRDGLPGHRDRARQAAANQPSRRFRPGHGLPPSIYDILLGKRVNQAVKKGTPVSWSLFD